MSSSTISENWLNQIIRPGSSDNNLPIKSYSQLTGNNYKLGYGEWLWSDEIMENVGEFFLPVNLVEDKTGYYIDLGGPLPPPLLVAPAIELILKASVASGNSILLFSPGFQIKLNFGLPIQRQAWITLRPKEKLIVMNLRNTKGLESLALFGQWKRRSNQPNSESIILSDSEAQHARAIWTKISLQALPNNQAVVELRTSYVGDGLIKTQDYLEIPAFKIIFHSLLISIPFGQTIFQNAFWQCHNMDPFTRDWPNAKSRGTFFIWEKNVKYCYEKEAFMEYLNEPNVLFPLPNGATYPLLGGSLRIRKMLQIPNLLGFQAQQSAFQQYGQSTVGLILNPVFATWNSLGFSK